MRKFYGLSDSIWRFGSVSRRSFNAPNVNDRSEVTEWQPATVPGNVRADLLALGRIPDPFFADQFRDSLWVEDRDWWYRRMLDLSIEPKQRAFLIFEGIDYLSSVFVGEKELGRHEGMFSRQIYEITDALRGEPRMPVEVAVRLWGSTALPRRQLSVAERAWAWLAARIDPTSVGAFPDRMATLKCQMSFGWDFAPPIRAMGIWDDAQVVVTGGVFVEDVRIQSQVPKTDSQPARLIVHVTVDSDQARLVQADAHIHPANFDGADWGPMRFDLDLPPGRSVHTLTFDLPNPQRWNPWDRGFPHLYNLTLSISDTQWLDSVSTRFGMRHITLDDWTFAINGQREFIRGVNWVPADSLMGRLRREDYDKLLDIAREAGVNLLRVWGGGLREKRAFYDLCDELGLLVWQEFPFACSFFGYFPRDAQWLRLVERECSAIVQEVRNHPSLALWCGGNEFGPSRNQKLVHTLERLVAVHDGTRPFVPASPSPGDAHNWDVWHGKYPLHAYQEEENAFLSEFGLQALPSAETLRACLPQDDLWPPARGWQAHKAELGKLRRYVKHSVPTTLDEFIPASQQAQALGLQIGIEHMRRRKGQTGGVCLWQFNEPWPAISWAIVDYYRRPKLAYERLKDLYNPLLVGLTFSFIPYRAGDTFRAEVWAVNDSLQSFEDCQLQIALDGMPIYQAEVTLPPDSMVAIDSLQHRFESDPREIEVTLRQDERLLSRNVYDATYHDSASPHWRNRLMRWLAEKMLA